MAKLSEVSVTEKSITVRVTGLDGTYSRSDRYVVFRKGGSPVSGEVSISAYATQSSTYTYTGLKADTEYDLEAYIYYTSNGSLKYSPVSARISTSSSGSSGGSGGSDGPSTENQIDNWYWDTNIYAGRAVSDVSYREWNSLIDKIDELLDTGHYGSWLIKSSEGATLSMSASKMNSQDKELTAERFNSVRYNIGAHRGTGVSRVYKDDIVYASYFDGLETGINNWIDDYNNDYT